MKPGLSLRLGDGVEERARFGLMMRPRARPLIGPAPRSTMFFPLVVLIAVLPGLVALNSWDLTSPGPLWGLRALEVLDGLVLDQAPAAKVMRSAQEALAYQGVAYQPPLYAWLAALGLRLSADCDPLACVLPSYVAGAVVVILVYLHGRLWRGGGVGLAAALLMGFNPSLLLRVQEATPSTLALAGALGALLCYGWYQRISQDSTRPWNWACPAFWVVCGGLCLGLSLLSLGGFGLFVVPVVALHQLYLGAPSITPNPRPGRARWWSGWVQRPGTIDAVLALGIAAIVAVPWYVMIIREHGWAVVEALADPAGGWLGDHTALLGRLIELSPVTLPLGLYGVVRSIRLALIDERDDQATVGGSLWVIWLGVAALLPATWKHGPRGAMDLFLLVPLHLLAATTVADLINRRVSVRSLIGLAPATAMSVAWWTSVDLRGAVDDLLHGRADAATALGLHLALDLVVALVWLTRSLERWARDRDDRQRRLLASFLLAILAVAVAAGAREVVFRHGETNDLLMLRTMILRRNRERPFDVVAVVYPDSARPQGMPPERPMGPGGGKGPLPWATAMAGGRLRFVLRTALPQISQRELGTIEELLALPEGQRLIILTGAGDRLPNAVKSRLGLESIHPGRTGVLDAYATASVRPSRR